MTALVRRRGGRPHRLLAGRAADRPRRDRRCATCCAGMVHEAGLDYIAAMLPINARSFVHITMVIFDTKNEAQARAAYDVARACSCARRRSSATASTARTWTSWTWRPTQYSFGDHAYRRFCETIKDAVDPTGILAPGKQGIWPRAMREA